MNTSKIDNISHDRTIKNAKIEKTSNSQIWSGQSKFNSRSRSEAIEERSVPQKMPNIKLNPKISPQNLLADMDKK